MGNSFILEKIFQEIMLKNQRFQPDFPKGNNIPIEVESRQPKNEGLHRNTTNLSMEIIVSLDFNDIGAMTNFSVGTLDGSDAMMVIEMASTPEDYRRGVRHQVPIAMTADHARELAEALLLAAEAAQMGKTPSEAVN